MTGNEKITAAIAGLNLIITGVIAVTGYNMVTRVQQGIDQARLQMDQTKANIDISKFLNDLRPVAVVDCTANELTPNSVRVACNQKNIGSQRILMDPPEVRLRQRGGDTFYATKGYVVKQQSGNVLPIGTSGGIAYLVEVPGMSAVDWTKVEVVTDLTAKTDPTILDIARQTLHDRVAPEKLDALAMQTYEFTSAVVPLQPVAAPASPATAPLPTASAPAAN